MFFNTYKKKYFLLVPLVAIFTVSVFSQEALKSTEEEYYDFLALEGLVERPTLNYRTLSDSVWNLSDDAEQSNLNIWKNNNLGTVHEINKKLKWKIYGPTWYNSYNTAEPYGQNDGALWQGVGYNTSLTAGVRLEAYGFEITLKPLVCFSQNLAFEYMASVYDSEYGYYEKGGGSIDYVQRYGDSPFFTFDWGDSEIRYTWKTLTLGFGTQSPWLGPAWLNPMLGSNNAATYPKLDFGLRKTAVTLPFLNWYIGDFEARVWTGYLSESDYFDDDDTNNHNMLNALSVSFAPSFIPGLTLGANRVFVTKWNLSNLYYIERLFTLSDGNAKEDQKASVTADWLFPAVGFEAYGELGIDDYSADKVSNPFHTMIYTIGGKKTVKILPKKNINGEIILEWNNFEMSQDFQLQWQYMGYYSHSVITQGYTNGGQIIGAGTGEFGNSQLIGFRVYYTKGNVFLYFHRYCPNNNYLYNQAVNNVADDVNDEYWAKDSTVLSLGLKSSYYLTKDFELTVGIIGSHFHNLYYGTEPETSNFTFILQAKYIF